MSNTNDTINDSSNSTHAGYTAAPNDSDRSLWEFKQTIAASFIGSAPQYYTLHYTKATQHSSLPLWRRFGPVCTVEEYNPVVFIQCGEDATSTSSPKITQRKATSFVGCHGCEAVYTYYSQNGTSALNSHKCPVPTFSPVGSHSMIN